MTILPLTLGVGRVSGTEKRGGIAFSYSKQDVAKIHQRDGNSCRFCGFHSQRYQKVAHADGHDDPVTACVFCEQCRTMDRSGVAGAGVLVWLPEIDQASLNHIVRSAYVAKAAGGEIATLAGRALDTVLARRNEAKKRLGSDDPLLLATVLYENFDDQEYKKILPKIDGIRLFVHDKYLGVGSVNVFPKMVDYWRSEQGAYAQLQPEAWLDMFKAVNDKAGHA